MTGRGMCLVLATVLGLGRFAIGDEASRGLTAKGARVCVVGWDVNRPVTFEGLGDFIGWTGGVAVLGSGEILVTHSAGYWHVSFASPRLIEEGRRKEWGADEWPVAPRGGRSMLVRSSNKGRTWSRPVTMFDHRLDDSPVTLFVCKDGTILGFINVQASWYGFEKAPAKFATDIDGLNTKQCVVRSSDGGRSWSAPIWIESPGTFYERSHGQAIQLPDGGILWPTYYRDEGDEQLYGAIQRSDDSGRTWRTVSKIRREGKNVDEPAIARLADGRLILVTRPDGGVMFSKDEGKTWTDSGRTVVSTGRIKAPRLFVLRDGTLVCVATWNNLRVFLSRDDGRTWGQGLPLDTSCYGYPGGAMLEDESILVSYCESGRAPNRVYLIRFRVNASRDGIELQPVARVDGK